MCPCCTLAHYAAAMEELRHDTLGLIQADLPGGLVLDGVCDDDGGIEVLTVLRFMHAAADDALRILTKHLPERGHDEDEED